MRVLILARRYHADRPHRVFVELRSILANAGIELVIDNSWSDEHATADLLIAVEPIGDRPALSEARLLGQRTLNRFQRMELAVQSGVPVTAFGSPRGDDDLTALAREWGDFAVLKYDWSSRRNGVFLWPLGAERKVFPSDFHSGQDLFMEFLGEDPQTYKIDAFAGTIVGSWVLQTRSMLKYDWQVIKDPAPRQFTSPAPLQRSIGAFSENLLEHGVGYASFDLMCASDGFRLIEANTCAASTSAWNLDPPAYASRLAEGIMHAIARLETVPEYQRLRGQAERAGNERSSIALQAKTPLKNPLGPGPASAEQLFYQNLFATERLPPDRLTAYTRRAAEQLLKHAFDTVPFYRDRLSKLFSWHGGIEWNRWPDVPLMSRDDLRRYGHALTSRSLPTAHGVTALDRTSGSTAEPVVFTVSAMQVAVENCIMARLYQWHSVHPAEAMATLWPQRPQRDGETRIWAPRWLRPPHGLDHGGDLAAAPEQQLRWLCELGPVYLRTRPSLARALALTAAENPDLRPTLKGILTQGEPVTQDHRRLCRKYLGCDLIDSYGLAETGTIAVRCPVSDVYHIQSETCLVELLNRDGRPCKAGEIGEIVVTPLYNFAMPLLRYATGDFAEFAFAGETDGRCACGRTLPALKRVFGHARNLFRAPDATLRQPDVNSRILFEHLGTRSWQLRQIGPGQFELHYESDWPKSRENRGPVTLHLSEAVQFAETIVFQRVEFIPMSLRAQREDFIYAPLHQEKQIGENRVPPDPSTQRALPG